MGVDALCLNRNAMERKMTNLNLSTGGDFSPFIKYNAKAGRWFVRGDNGTDVEIPSPRFAIDLANIRQGWIMFPQASPPSFVWDVQGMRAPKPEGDYKDGFKVFVMGTDPQPALANQNIGVREWSSNAYVVKAGMMELYRQYEATEKQNPNGIPVVRCVSVKCIKGEYGDNFEPVFVIEAWVGRDRVPQLTAAVSADLQSVQPIPAPDAITPFASPSPLSVKPPAMAQSGNSQSMGPGDQVATGAKAALPPISTDPADMHPDVMDDPVPF
ncbi:MAG TPA: hypothetical protein ENH62_11860 [Marinobacter sp.]|nr:hypothetical protein [Marinobacter sp.]